jgi:hypothetical protein
MYPVPTREWPVSPLGAGVAVGAHHQYRSAEIEEGYWTRPSSGFGEVIPLSDQVVRLRGRRARLRRPRLVVHPDAPLTLTRK